jgi:hypothetical protein
MVLLNSLIQAPTLSTIYSAKGTDRIDLTGITRSSVVNLNAGTFSSINQLKPNSTSNTSYSGNSNVSIAFGSKINNIDLSTSNTADTVILNAAYKSNAFNAIKNFQASDKIGLSSSVFGNLTSDNIDIGVGRTTANTAKSKILVDSTTGKYLLRCRCEWQGIQGSEGSAIHKSREYDYR